MNTFLKPVDLLSFAFVGLLAALSLVFLPSIPHGGWLIVRFGLLIAGLTALAYYTAHANSWKPARYLHAFLPVLIVPVVFDSMGDLIPWVRHRTFDDLLIAADRALFGVDPTVWLERSIRPWLTDLLQLAYTSYYPMPVAVAVVLAAKGKWHDFNRAVFGLVLCFYLSYLGYLLLPAVGPRFTIEHAAGLQGSPMAYAIQETLNALENTKTDAFPSGHTAIALMSLLYAWRSRERVLTAVLVPCVAGLVFATVYLRYHYVIDVIAGVALAAITVAIAPRLRSALEGLRREPGQPRHHTS